MDMLSESLDAALPEVTPVEPAPQPYATVVTVEGRLIRLVRDGQALTLHIETGRGRYEAVLDRWQTMALRHALAEG